MLSKKSNNIFRHLYTTLPKVLTYSWGGDENPPSVGMRVVVPLGNRRLTGVVWHVHNNDPAGYILKM